MYHPHCHCRVSYTITARKPGSTVESFRCCRATLDATISSLISQGYTIVSTDRA